MGSGHSSAMVFQSTLSMRRASVARASHGKPTAISIHALHEESDLLSTNVQPVFCISIHALHEESD